MSSDTEDSNEEYLEKASTFLKKYQWIYSYRNTDILTKRILSNIPRGWAQYFDDLCVADLHDLVRGIVKDTAPSDFKSFVEDINYLSSNYPCASFVTEELLIPKNSGLSEKKSHEIALLAPVIHEVCEQAGCDLIVDIGCGVGHLAHLLYNKYGYNILGLEVSGKLVNSAVKSQERHQFKSRGSVVFKELFVNEFSSTEIEELIETYFGSTKKVCLTGLHACADLNVEVLKLFSNFKAANAIVIMPCCYHRMEVVNQDPEIHVFKSFPSSILMKALFDKYKAYSFLGQPFLRLACQQTNGSFVTMTMEEHQSHAEQCMYRALLQLVAETENCTVRRLKRKSGISKTSDSDKGFQAYLNNLITTHELVGRSSDVNINVTDDAFLQKMHEKWTEYKNDCWQVEVLMGLQAAIQSICENVILLDRVEFLKEKGFYCCKRKITNDCISPRCWALIAKKNVL